MIALSERRVEPPFLLRVAMVVGGVLGVLGTSVGLWALFQIVLWDGSLAVNGEMVSRSEFLLVAGAFVVLGVLACLTAGAASLALWQQRPRSRVLLVVLLAEFVLGDAGMLILAGRRFEVGVGELAASAFLFAVVVLLALWYLYRKSAVVQYYESLGRWPVGGPSPAT